MGFQLQLTQAKILKSRVLFESEKYKSILRTKQQFLDFLSKIDSNIISCSIDETFAFLVAWVSKDTIRIKKTENPVSNKGAQIKLEELKNILSDAHNTPFTDNGYILDIMFPYLGT